MKKKVILSVLCAVALMASSAVATVAYLTSQDQVVNTFTIGKVELALDEADVDKYGTPIANAPRVKENTYVLVPGRTYTKDPTVTVKAGSENSYIRMLVTINRNVADLTAAFCQGTETFLPQNFVQGWDPAVWVPVSIDETTAGQVTYEFRYFETVDGFDDAGAQADQTLAPLFTEFNVPGEVTGEKIAALGAASTEDFKITVVAHAVQQAGLADADTAWQAFDAQKTASQPTPTPAAPTPTPAAPNP